MSSFHAKQHAVTQAIRETLEMHPHLESRIRELDEHYMLGGLERPSPFGLYAAVRLHIDEDYIAVRNHFSKKFQMVLDQAEKHIIDAVNKGPELLKDEEDFLHTRGIMRGTDRYHLGQKGKGLHLGGIYDRAWQTIETVHRPIVAEAVTAASSPKHKSIEKRVMQYVAVLLMPEGDTKLFMLNKLSLGSEKKHGPYVREACDFIRLKANELGITVSETLLANKAAERKVLPKIPAPLGSSRMAASAETKPVSPEFTGGAAAPREKAIIASEQNNEAYVPARDMVKLKRDLKTLEHRGKITEKHAKLYFWLQDGSDEEPRTVEDAAKRLDKDVRKIRLIVANVKTLLRELEPTIYGRTPSSDGNLHKASTVRP